MVLPVEVLNATDAMTAVEPLQRSGFVQTYTHKGRDPLVKEQITAAGDRSDGPQRSRCTQYRPYPRR